MTVFLWTMFILYCFKGVIWCGFLCTGGGGDPSEAETYKTLEEVNKYAICKFRIKE